MLLTTFRYCCNFHKRLTIKYDSRKPANKPTTNPASCPQGAQPSLLSSHWPRKKPTNGPASISIGISTASIAT